MSCSETRAALPALIHDLLPAHEADGVVRHAEACQACAGERARLEGAFAGLREALREEPPVPEATWEALAPSLREAFEPDPTLGRVGDYALVGTLGVGGMGAVYEGRHVALGTRVAVKSIGLPPGPSAYRDRCAREVAAARLLDHPNLSGVLTWIDEEARGHLVSEYLEGDDLDRKLMDAGRLSPGECLPWLIDACRGLAHAHERGLVHRDLKPANILIDPSGVARVLDFGRILLDDAASRTACGGGMVLGTVIYMSKEQLLGKPLDARSDVYSLGVTLYECVTGQLPFYDEDERRLVVKIAKAPPTPPSHHWPEIPPALEAVILKAIAKEPEDRFQSAFALERALAAVLEEGDPDLDATSAKRGAPVPTPVRAGRGAAALPSRATLLAAAVGCGVLALAALPLALFGSGVRRAIGALLLTAVAGVSVLLLLLLALSRADRRGEGCRRCGGAHPTKGCPNG